MRLRSLKWKAQRVGKAAKLRFNATESRFNAAVLQVTRYGGSPHIQDMNMREVMPINK